MNYRRVLAVTRKSLSQFRHDKRTLGFVVGMPLLMVLAFGYTFGGQVHDVRTIVVNQDVGPMGARLVQNITGDTLSLVAYADLPSARGEIQASRAWAVLWLPQEFSQELVVRNAIVHVLLDGSSPPIVSAVLATVRASAEKAYAGAGGAAALSLAQDYVYGNVETRFIDSFAPGVIALAVLMVSTIVSVILIVREKTGGMLERLFATPLSPLELVLGQAAALSLVAVAQSAVILAAAILLFQIQVAGSIALVFLIILLFGVGNQGLGMVASAAARNELQAVQFIPLVLFPSILLGGIFYPLEAIPGGLRPLSYAVPTTYAADAMRSVMLRGWGVGDIALDVVALGLYALVTLLAATILIRRQA
jgi:ABC-2 type transport system permease protein